jgi:hypothetical protein
MESSLATSECDSGRDSCAVGISHRTNIPSSASCRDVNAESGPERGRSRRISAPMRGRTTQRTVVSWFKHNVNREKEQGRCWGW